MNILLQTAVRTTGGVSPVCAYALAEPAGEYQTARAPRLLERLHGGRSASRQSEALCGNRMTRQPIRSIFVSTWYCEELQPRGPTSCADESANRVPYAEPYN